MPAERDEGERDRVRFEWVGGQGYSVEDAYRILSGRPPDRYL
jgi:hypothetical protein